jgi:putative transposase
MDYIYIFLVFLIGSTAKALNRFVERSHLSIWKWIQKYKPQKVSNKRKNINEFVVDETLIKIGSEIIWLWVAIEPKNRQILKVDISFERKYVCNRTFSIQPFKRIWGAP